MSKLSSNSFSNSLKGKIWLAVTALALFISTFGIISYLLISFLLQNPIYAVFIPFLLLSITVLFFGLWLSNEVINPIEKLILFARSMERGVSSSPPKTSGSTETDELLNSLHKLNQQMLNLVSSMDEVSHGNLDAVFAPSANSDRLTSSFQKLLARVSESIHAKQELDRIQKDLTNLSLEISNLKRNNLNFSIRTKSSETEEITACIEGISSRLSILAGHIKANSVENFVLVKELQGKAESVLLQYESNIKDINRASIVLGKVPELVDKVTDELSKSATSVRLSIEKAQSSSRQARGNLDAVNHHRKNLREAGKRLQKLDQYTLDIAKVAKTVEDLAQRTNMVALNASIQATELGEKGRGLLVVSDEVERLAERANTANKDIYSLNKAIQSEIRKIEATIETTMQEAADLSKFSIETENTLTELERNLSGFLAMQNKALAYSREQNEKTEAAFNSFTESLTDNEKAFAEFGDSSELFERVLLSMEQLYESVSDISLPSETETTSMPGRAGMAEINAKEAF